MAAVIVFMVISLAASALPSSAAVLTSPAAYTAENITRATCSGLASIFGIGLGGRPRGRVLTGLVATDSSPSFTCTVNLGRSVWLDKRQ